MVILIKALVLLREGNIMQTSQVSRNFHESLEMVSRSHGNVTTFPGIQGI